MSELKETTLLDKLSFPDELKDLTDDQLALLSNEIRGRLLEIGDKCGGHLASNLGVVELSVVLHTLFSSPTDKFVWDTSHQTYIHKMLTGRLDKMLTIRQENGLSGFAITLTFTRGTSDTITITIPNDGTAATGLNEAGAFILSAPYNITGDPIIQTDIDILFRNMKIEIVDTTPVYI